MTATGVDAMPFTIAQFALMAIFAVLVIGGMIYGRTLKQRRTKAEAEIEEHREAVVDREDAPAATVAQPADPELAADVAPEAPPAPPPLAPAPPPLADQPVVATPAQCDAMPLAGDLTRLKGLGPKLAATLAGLGITRVDQIAALSPEEMAALDARLGAFRGRPARDRWAEQARLLTTGDTGAYEAEFGKLGGVSVSPSGSPR